MTDIPERPTSDQLTAADVQCYCPVGEVIDLLGRKYAIQVVCVVGAMQPARYTEVEAAFGEVSSSTLSTRLSELTEAGLLDREQRNTIPPEVQYRLTTDGEELCTVLEPLLQWVNSRNPSG